MDGIRELYLQGQTAVGQPAPMKQYSGGGLFYKATVMLSIMERLKAWLAAGFSGVWYTEQDGAVHTGS